MAEKARPPGDSLEELQATHDAIEVRLAELDRHLALTADEQLERTRLKKLKLQTKDRMARLG
jgi:hypothetical protein